MFAGSCIGVVILVMFLEFLRRASREYDRYLISHAQLKQLHYVSAITAHSADNGFASTAGDEIVSAGSPARKFRPNVRQQVIRALFHMVQFAVAYFIMLLAMYYNGYIIISIIIGAFLGAFVFNWDYITLG